MTKRVKRVPTPSPHSPPPVTAEGIALSDTEKAEALADNLEAQFQPVTDPSIPARRLHLSARQTCITQVCNRASLGSEPRQPINQSLSLPCLVQGNLGPNLWHNQSRPSA